MESEIARFGGFVIFTPGSRGPGPVLLRFAGARLCVLSVRNFGDGLA